MCGEENHKTGEINHNYSNYLVFSGWRLVGVDGVLNANQKTCLKYDVGKSKRIHHMTPKGKISLLLSTFGHIFRYWKYPNYKYLVLMSCSNLKLCGTFILITTSENSSSRLPGMKQLSACSHIIISSFILAFFPPTNKSAGISLFLMIKGILSLIFE